MRRSGASSIALRRPIGPRAPTPGVPWLPAAGHYHCDTKLSNACYGF